MIKLVVSENLTAEGLGEWVIRFEQKRSKLTTFSLHFLSVNSRGTFSSL